MGRPLAARRIPRWRRRRTFTPDDRHLGLLSLLTDDIARPTPRERDVIRRPMGHPPGPTTCTAVRGAPPLRKKVVSSQGRQRQRQGDLTPCHFQRIAHRGACGKTRVGPQNRRPEQERTKTWGHDVRVSLSTDGGRGDEPPVPDWSGGRQREMRTCRRGSTLRETPVIPPASAGQWGTAASEVSR